MRVLTRDEILTVSDLAIEAVETPEWGEDAGVYVRGMTGAERDAFESEGIEADDSGKISPRSQTNAYARFAALVCCNESGARIFAEGDTAALGKRSSAPLARIWRVGQRLSGLGPEAEKKLKKK